MSDQIIGLIGGMGPYASSYFYQLLLDKSGKEFGAKNNDEFPEILLDSVPVPDFISDTQQLDKARNMLLSRVMKLNGFGCTVLGMVCNTGHLLYPDLAGSSAATFISLINEVSKRVQTMKLKRVGLFATKTTIKMRLYQQALQGSGVELVLPDQKMQDLHEKIIREVIAEGASNRYEDQLVALTQQFVQDNNLDGLILGCTELPLVFPKQRFTNVIDCLDVLADALLRNYYRVE